MRLKQYTRYRKILEGKIYEAERLIELNEIKKQKLKNRIKEINIEAPLHFLENYKPSNTKDKLKHSDIIGVVLDYYEMSNAEMFSKYKGWDIIQKRQICQYFLKRYTKLSLSFIGEITGNRDHSTVIHSVKTITNLYGYDKSIKKQVNEITLLLRSLTNKKKIKPQLRRQRK